MESKTTIRRVSGAEYRKAKQPKPREEFTLFGKVLKVSEKTNSILVQKGNSTSEFWMSCYDHLSKVKEGDKVKFTITIPTFVSKKDSTFITHLNIKDVELLPEEADLQEGFVTGHIPVQITSALKTDIPGIYILTAKRMMDGEEMETYYLKYFTKDEFHIDLGNAIIRFTLQLSKYKYTNKGEEKVDIQTRTYTNTEGEEITIESEIFRPTLSILEIIR